MFSHRSSLLVKEALRAPKKRKQVEDEPLIQESKPLIESETHHEPLVEPLLTAVDDDEAEVIVETHPARKN